MIRFSKLLFIAIVALLLLWQLPWFYRFVTAKASSSPFVLFSPVINDFAMISRDENGALYTDLAGNQYSNKEFDALLPTFFARQLVADGTFPDTINGVAVTPRQIQLESIHFRSSPLEINKPTVGLYYLLESMSGRVDLSMPDDVFRITDHGIEFVDIKSNSVNEEKSLKFSQMMKKKGFVFPALTMAGNPTTRKEYDEGYLLTDSQGKLFHLKQTQGLPYVRAIDLPQGILVKHLFVTEFPTRKTLAFFTDDQHSFYVLKSKSYEVVKVEIPSFNPEKNYLTIIGDLFYWTIFTETEEGGTYFAVNAETFQLEKRYNLYEAGNSRSDFPLSIRFTDSKDKFVKPRI